MAGYGSAVADSVTSSVPGTTTSPAVMLSPNARIRVRLRRGAAATVTGNVHDALRDCVSVAVHSTVVLPTGNSAFGCGEQLTVTGCAPPSTEGTSKLTIDGPLKGAVIAIGDGQDREGGGADTAAGVDAST